MATEVHGEGVAGGGMCAPRVRPARAEKPRRSPEVVRLRELIGLVGIERYGSR